MANLESYAPLFWEAVRSAAAALPRFQFSIAGTKFNADRKPQHDHDIVEYQVSWPSASIPVFLEFYENDRGHWRLFGFTTDRGMLFSVNLSTAFSEFDRIPLQQKIRISGAQKSSQIGRRLAKDKCVDVLVSEGFHVDGDTIMLGEFDCNDGKFASANGMQFLKDFIKVSIIKGHFMRNKGYRIEGLV